MNSENGLQGPCSVLPWALEDFLQTASGSSGACAKVFSDLLALLEHHKHQRQARKFLDKIVESQKESHKNIHFHFHSLDIPGSGMSGPLTLLQFPSVFAPEDWSFTFFEGLLRYDTRDFLGKSAVELGCGNGWITLATALRCQTSKQVGLDLNPKAILCARLNLYLNALDDQGNPVTDPGGTPLLDKVSFQVSDLLNSVTEKKEKFDFIFGCIPQVLNPKLPATLPFGHVPIQDTWADSELYDLSNYTTPQGKQEDEFGLGLIARALEESVDALNAGGRIILNLGGRPGEKLLTHLFRRRGFHVKKVWQNRVEQAQDTDISPLVERERWADHRFEFFSSENAVEPISATAAQHYIKNGGRIFHALSVYEGTLGFPFMSQRCFQALRKPEWKTCLDYLDLSYDASELTEEKIVFLNQLIDKLDVSHPFPYSDTLGDPKFLNKISRFLNTYFKLPCSPQDTAAFPSRLEILEGLRAAHDANCIFVDSELYDSRHKLTALLNALPDSNQNPHALNPAHTTYIPIPRSAEVIGDLMRKIKPNIVFCSLPPFESNSPHACERLIEYAAGVGAQIVFDISHQLDLTSEPRRIGVLEALGNLNMPPHAGVMAELIKNKIYPDLTVAFLCTANRLLMNKLQSFAEISYSRVPLLNQWFYEGVLGGLLNFQMLDWRSRGRATDARTRDLSSEVIPPQPAEKQNWTHHPAFATAQPHASTVRLDYGENALPVSPLIKSALLGSFCKKQCVTEQSWAQAQLRHFLENRFGLKKELGHVFFTEGVAPVFYKISRALKKENIPIFFSNAAYGYFDATLKYFGVPVVSIPVTQENKFKMQPQDILHCLNHSGFSPSQRTCLYINAPICNPSGARISKKELNEFIKLAENHKAILVIDTVFSGLEFDKPEYDLLENLNHSSCSFVVMGSVSKEWACGGLRLGYALTNDPEIEKIIRIQNRPHSTMVTAAASVYRDMMFDNSCIESFLKQQRDTLKQRALRLEERLEKLGWQVTRPDGGLFFVAKEPYPQAGKELFSKKNILVNLESWIGIPDHCRFVFAVDDEIFEEALRRL